MSRGDDVVGGAGLHLVGGALRLHRREQVFEAMLEGWRNQRLARNLAGQEFGEYGVCYLRYGKRRRRAHRPNAAAC